MPRHMAHFFKTKSHLYAQTNDYQDADEVKINRGTDFTLALHVLYP